MDGAALPTFANAAVTKKKPSRSSQMSEQQFLFCQQMGVFVPPDQVPLGHQLGDKFWSDALAHPDVAIVRGKSFHVDWMLIVPKSVLSRVASWTALVEEALVPVHEQLSKWNENSLLNRLNKDKIVQNVPQLFEQTIVLCNELHRASGGRFDPSIAPVLEAWTLALDEGKASLSQAQKENLEACVGWEKVLHQYKLSQGAKIDLDGVSKGIGVDLIARKLKEVTGGCFFFDWGGEGASAGKHPTGRSWRLGVMKVC
jgi:thiamine biosynthesis lipoprotein